MPVAQGLCQAFAGCRIPCPLASHSPATLWFVLAFPICAAFTFHNTHSLWSVLGEVDVLLLRGS